MHFTPHSQLPTERQLSAILTKPALAYLHILTKPVLAYLHLLYNIYSCLTLAYLHILTKPVLAYLHILYNIYKFMPNPRPHIPPTERQLSARAALQVSAQEDTVQ